MRPSASLRTALGVPAHGHGRPRHGHGRPRPVTGLPGTVAGVPGTVAAPRLVHRMELVYGGMPAGAAADLVVALLDGARGTGEG
ncbi:hypothetical protein [Streptomyces sp. NPDC086519]|uniref:hypothetical protein n=1 Tax=Streptomyces sp. NPDC086519 TaxID=3154863 RepID=UPI003444D04C